ncbi:MAG: DUF1844 domain-containing protein [bacterium]
MNEDKKEETQKPVEPETKSTEPEEKDRVMPEASFLQLSFLLGAQAMQSLGVIPNPLTNKTESDLLLAKFNIDLLEMLKEKTKGNLAPEEEKGFQELLFNLRMLYVETSNKKNSPKS